MPRGKRTQFSAVCAFRACETSRANCAGRGARASHGVREITAELRVSEMIRCTRRAAWGRWKYYAVGRWPNETERGKKKYIYPNETFAGVVRCCCCCCCRYVTTERHTTITIMAITRVRLLLSRTYNNYRVAAVTLWRRRRLRLRLRRIARTRPPVFMSRKTAGRPAARSRARRQPKPAGRRYPRGTSLRTLALRRCQTRSTNVNTAPRSPRTPLAPAGAVVVLAESCVYA